MLCPKGPPCRRNPTYDVGNEANVALSSHADAARQSKSTRQSLSHSRGGLERLNGGPNGKRRALRQTSKRSRLIASASCGQGIGRKRHKSLDEFTDLAAEDELDPWAGARLILGPALKLRAQRAQGTALAQSYMDVIHKFEAAFEAHSRRSPAPIHRDNRPARDPPGAKASQGAANADGVDLVLQAIHPFIAGNTDLLENAVALFRKECAPPVREADFWMWVASTNNLGCALTLLGRSRGGEGGFSDLEEAVDAFRALLSEPMISEMPSELASVHVNLAGALQALAESAMPAERVRYLASAVESLAIALGIMVPARYKGLVEMWCGVSA
jgi:hypothetical protein